MTTYKDALKKLQHIYDECNPDNIAQVKSLGKKDEFSRMRRQLNQDIRQTRIVSLLYRLNIIQKFEYYIALEGTG